MSLAVICPARKPHPRTVALLNQFAPGAVIPYMNDSEAYWRLLQGWWRGNRPFALVEHDVGIHRGVVPQFEKCLKPWCVFPYQGPIPAGESAHSVIDRGFGCVRFSAALLGETRGLLDSLPRHWASLADVVADALEDRGYQRHVHRPPVGHYHYD